MPVDGNSFGDAEEGWQISRYLHCDANYEVSDCLSNNIFIGWGKNSFGDAKTDLFCSLFSIP